MASPSYLFVELAREHSDHQGLLDAAAAAVRSGGGEVLAYAPCGRIACLEPGTVASGMLIARWADPAALTQVAKEMVVPLLDRGMPGASAPLVLRVSGLPSDGLPDMMDIPTVASVPTAPRVPRNALMVIRGSVFSQAGIDGYRDVILPMIKERRGYYEVFALQPGEVEALSGKWTEQIFAISRWPQRSNAEDFWYSDRYQTYAIPKRLGNGRFDVHLLDAAGQ